MRPEGWEGLLAEHVAEAGRQFQWGERDCVLWAADWVRKITGTDHAEQVRGRYATESEAARLMAELGFKDVAAVADAHLESVRPKLARRGDLLLHPCGMLGICCGKNGVFLTERGVTSVRTLACPRAWRVG